MVEYAFNLTYWPYIQGTNFPCIDAVMQDSLTNLLKLRADLMKTSLAVIATLLVAFSF